MVSHTETGVVEGRRLNSLVAFAFGAVFVLVGLSGFFVSGGHHAVGADGGALLGLFQVNVLHNVVHLAIGALLVLGALRGPRPSRGVNTLVGAVYLLVGVLGLFVLESSLNILALNTADNLLHFASAALLLGVGLMADKRAR